MNARPIFDKLPSAPRPRRRSRRARPLHRKRRAAAMLSTAVVLTLFLTLVFGMIELALAVFNQHVVTQAARQLARKAIVHGQMAPPKLTAWSPGTLGGSGTAYSVAATDSGEVATALQPYLAGLDLRRTSLSLEWLDGNNELESRVRAQVTTTHQPFLTFIFRTGWTLRGESTMQIAH
jgi:Flp pilus assembly protein TadG